jgi:hypothetical protein
MISAQLALGEPGLLRIAATAGYGIAFGLLAAAVLDPLLGILSGRFGWIWLWVGALAFTISTVVRGFARLAGLPGIGLAILTVFILGNPSAGTSVPTSFLPGLYRAVGPYLPPGAAATGLLGTTYFDAPLTRPALVLGAWALAAVAALVVSDRVRGRRRPLAFDAAAAAGWREPSHR